MRVRGTRLLNLNQRVHHLKTGRPTGVTVRTAALGDGYIDVVLTGWHSETLPNNRGRIMVVVILVCVHRSRQRRRARFAVHLHFPTTPLATAYNAQVIVVQDLDH